MGLLWFRHYHVTALLKIPVLLFLLAFSIFLMHNEMTRRTQRVTQMKRMATMSKSRITEVSEDATDIHLPDISEGESCRLCPVYPPHLKKRLAIEPNITLEETERRLKDSVSPGGLSYPKECLARWRIALIVPYRDRESQIGPFLNHMFPFLQRQQLNVSIYIVNQTDSKPFNRARLLNVGFVESLPDGPFDCYVFHDIDLLPEDDRHLYHCSSMPRHLNVAASNTGYKPLYRIRYSMYFGGACSMTRRHFEMVNGWSNKYWGWGGEDDDLRRRIAIRKLHVWRFPKEIAKYTMLSHLGSQMNPNRYEDLRKNIKHFTEDGLNSLKYDFVSKERRPLFTAINVNFDKYFDLEDKSNL